MTRRYKKSSRSGGSGGDCVEWAVDPSHVWVRDSKHPTGPELVMTPAEWSGLVAAVAADAEHPWISGTQIIKDGTTLSFTPSEWAAFTDAARTGECLVAA
jgi:hypothetical protein